MAGSAISVPIACLLAACGGEDNDTEPDGAVSTATETPTAPNESTSQRVGESEEAQISSIELVDETADERTLRHALSETTIPADPKRIVALSSGAIDSLVALDIQPAGISTFTGHDFTSFSYLEPQLSEIPIVGTFVEPNFEAVLAAEARATIDEAVGKETVAFLRVMPDEYRVSGNARLVGPIIYGDLGLEPDLLVRELAWEEEEVVISNERIPDFTTDYIFLLDQSQGTDVEGDIAALTDNPLWQATPAVQQGSVYHADRDICINIGLIAAERVIDVVLNAMGGE